MSFYFFLFVCCLYICFPNFCTYPSLKLSALLKNILQYQDTGVVIAKQGLEKACLTVTEKLHKVCCIPNYPG